jgi:hypothetical protein
MKKLNLNEDLLSKLKAIKSKLDDVLTEEEQEELYGGKRPWVPAPCDAACMVTCASPCESDCIGSCQVSCWGSASWWH